MLSINLNFWYNIFVILSILLFIIFLVAELIVFEKDVSISRMIVDSGFYSLGFMVLIWVSHVISILLYLIILSQYISPETWRFKIIVVLNIIYNISLLITLFVNLDKNDEVHNIFAQLAFVFALLSSVINKQNFYQTSSTADKQVWYYQFLKFSVIGVIGVLFWLSTWGVFEYIFILLILLDKKFNLLILEFQGLLNVNLLVLELNVSEKIESINTKYKSPPNSIF
jgi:hypothetical protein